MSDTKRAPILVEDKDNPINDANIERVANLIGDGLENLVANLGTGEDKRTFSTFVNNKLLSATGNKTELNALYRTNWLAGKVVDIIPNDMTREWRSFTGDITPEQVQELVDEEERLELSNKFNMGDKWARLYGTAFIVMAVDDGQTPDKPLKIENIRKGGLQHINVVDRHRLSTADVQPIADPLNPNFGFPEFYRFNDTSTKIHHSRVLRFDGVLLPFDEFRRNNFYSDSVLDRLYESITNFDTATSASASMIYETNVDIVKVKGLMDYLQTADGEARLRKRFALAKLMKSFNNMTLLDSEEELDTKSNTFASLPDLIDRFAQFLSSGSDIPATRLLGNSASGMNSTGEGDLKNYYDMIASLQKNRYKPRLDYFDQIMAKSLGMSDDANLSYKFNPLFQMTPKEQADTDFAQAQTDKIYWEMEVVDSLIIAKELKQRGTYTNVTDEHIKELEKELDDIKEEDLNGGFNTRITDPEAAETGEEDEDDKDKDEEGEASQDT